MPQHKSCKKRLLQAEKANAMNRVIRTAATKAAALEEMPKLFSMLDKAAVSHRAGFCANRAANYKAKVAKVINGLA